MRTAIIGGGIAGLAAAYELEKARAAGEAVEYTLFESRDRLGGSLASEIVDGVVLERGPDSFLTEKPAAIELCRELGLGDQLVPSNDAERKTYILVKNRMVALPDGLMFLVPTKLVPTALTPLFSLPTKVAWDWSCCIRRGPQVRKTSPWRRWSSGTSAPKPWTVLPTPAFWNLWRRRRATERPHRAAPAGGDGERVWLADARHAGGHRKMREKSQGKRQEERECRATGNGTRPARAPSSLRFAAECSNWWTR